MPYAQNASSGFALLITGLRQSVQFPAQRGPDEAAERPPKGVGGLALSIQ
jgi:hypothetical protein